MFAPVSYPVGVQMLSGTTMFSHPLPAFFTDLVQACISNLIRKCSIACRAHLFILRLGCIYENPFLLLPFNSNNHYSLLPMSF